jgi:hypothetical protein
MITERKGSFCLLSKRQRIAASLIKHAPHLYSAVYRLYADKLQRNPYK